MNGGNNVGSPRFLMVNAGSCACGVPLEHVIEIMRPLPVEPIAHVPRFVLGLSVVRGSPVPVLNLRGLLAGNASVPVTEARASAQARFVALKLEERTVVLAVDEVVGVRAVARSTFEELPALLRDEESDVVASIATLDASLLFILQTARLYPAELDASITEARS